MAITNCTIVVPPPNHASRYKDAINRDCCYGQVSMYWWPDNQPGQIATLSNRDAYDARIAQGWPMIVQRGGDLVTALVAGDVIVERVRYASLELADAAQVESDYSVPPSDCDAREGIASQDGCIHDAASRMLAADLYLYYSDGSRVEDIDTIFDWSNDHLRGFRGTLRDYLVALGARAVPIEFRQKKTECWECGAGLADAQNACPGCGTLQTDNWLAAQ